MLNRRGCRLSPYSAISIQHFPYVPVSIFTTPRCRLTAMMRCLSCSNSGRHCGSECITSFGVVSSCDMIEIEPMPRMRSRIV